jgi:hypothetical protein
MPSHIDAIVAALREPWFFGDSGGRTTASKAGENYGTILRDKFNLRRDQAAIDKALGLGFYVIHSEGNKRQRMALRAVLAAHVLMKNRDADDIARIRPTYESMSFDALKRAFVNFFPLDDDKFKRRAWSTMRFTDPCWLRALRTRQDWRNKAIPSYQFLVHTNDNPTTAPLWQDPVAELSKYSCSSLTLLSNQKPFTYFVQGVILRVPAVNVLVTYHADLMSKPREESVHKPKFLKHTFAEEIHELAMASGGELLSPAEIIQKQGLTSPSVGVRSLYNEILVCGTSGVPLPWGVTGPLKLVGVFMQTDKKGDLLRPFDAPQRLKACQDCAKRFHVPLLFLPNAA